jgi:hypothetical protein
MRQMDQRLAEVNKVAQFEMAAKSDPEMARLLAAFNSDTTKVKELAE